MDEVILLKDLGKVKLRKHIAAIGFFEDGEFIVESKSLKCYGSGNSKEEAIEMIKYSIADLWLDLKDESLDNLFDSVKKLKQLLHELIDI